MKIVDLFGSIKKYNELAFFITQINKTICHLLVPQKATREISLSAEAQLQLVFFEFINNRECTFNPTNYRKTNNTTSSFTNKKNYCYCRYKPLKMEDLSNVYMTPLPDSPYVRPFRFNYTQGGKEKNWDMLEVHDSVAIIVFNVTRNVLVFVKQFRPAIYYNSVSPSDREDQEIDTTKYPASLGITLEMCAGIVDKNKSLQEIAKEEVLEECGYDVPIKELYKISSYRSGVGVQGALQTMFYCEVTDDMKVSKGGGVEDEIIEVVEKSIPEVEKWLTSPGILNSPPSCLYALTWFLRYKADKYRKSFERYCGECKIVQDDGIIATCM